MYFLSLHIKNTSVTTGLAKHLVKTCLDTLGSAAINILLNTKEENLVAQSLYQNLGFHVVEGKAVNVSHMRQDGSVKKDRRIFMFRIINKDKLSQ